MALLGGLFGQGQGDHFWGMVDALMGRLFFFSNLVQSVDSNLI